VPDASGRQDGDRNFRMKRRRFVGTGLAVAGAAMVPGAGGLTARSRAATGQEAAGQASAQASGPAAGGPIPQLPLRGKYPHLPAVPLDKKGVPDTLARLQLRAKQTTQAKQGLTRVFEINGVRRPAYTFLYGSATGQAQSDAMRSMEESLAANPDQLPGLINQRLGQRDDAAAPTRPLSLESPRQFSLSWTQFPDVLGPGRRHLSDWASSLTDADSATRQFWPMIAKHGFGYNLIIPERVRGDRADELRHEFGDAWTRKVRAALEAGNLYVIDMSRFERLQPPQSVNGAPRFTPGTVTLLIRDPQKKSLEPVAIIVAGHKGSGRQVYPRDTATNGAWLYALQAAKASVTLFGVWLGHVYQWHIVTCAMQMTMFNTLPTSHPIYQLLAPQSKFAIEFDDALLLLWSHIAPPTPLTTANDFLALANDFADGRAYFDDDPTTTLSRLGLRERDFTVKTAWDKYPVVQRLLQIWDLVGTYVQQFVSTTYASDVAVAGDRNLQRWMATASSSNASTGGNIRGLPRVNSRAALENILRSLLYRITIHGISRLNSTSNPALTFVANFPHCLQRTDIPSPTAQIGTKELIGYLPNTNTIAGSIDFYYVFTYSTPYESFVPLGGAPTELFFSGGRDEPRNRALIDLRSGLASFIREYQPDMNERFQWPRNIET
jgi:Lipoxygenase